ncbi:MAG: alpha-L-fucosidase [Mycobacteriales bacterium]
MARHDWFVHDRFGLFLHWGAYSAAARHEWVKSREQLTDAEYQPYVDHFDPDRYDPVAWARLARRAGMRYAVLTTKHHDGFCLFDSALTDYKARRDLVAPWVEAFRAEGLRVGFYYSLIDWHHPEFPLDGLHPQRDDEELRSRPRDGALYREYLHGQVRELLTGYGRIDVLWLDFSYPHRDWGWARGKGLEDWDATTLLATIRALQPDILVNDRLGVPGDFRTPEQYQPASWPTVDGARVVWEACQTLNGSWGYDRDNLDWKPPELLVRMLVDGVSKGGNLLLNVGPTARGTIDPRATATLEAIGEWMDLHERSVRGATASDLTPPTGCRYTQRGDRLYLHLFDWPPKHVFLPDLAGRVAYAQFLHDGSEVRQVRRDPASHHTAATIPEGALGLILPIQRPPVAVPVVELFLNPA